MDLEGISIAGSNYDRRRGVGIGDFSAKPSGKLPVPDRGGLPGRGGQCRRQYHERHRNAERGSTEGEGLAYKRHSRRELTSSYLQSRGEAGFHFDGAPAAYFQRECWQAIAEGGQCPRIIRRF